MSQPNRWNAAAKGLYHTLWTAVDWLYPPFCGGCGEFGSRWCVTCQASVTRLGENICQHCGDLLSEAGICKECHSHPPPYSSSRSWAVFDGTLRRAIHRLKYNRDLGLGEPLATGLIALLKELNWQIDLIAPVPLSPLRYTERGYNQSALLAKPLALATHISYSTKVIQRTRETQTQVGLNARERKVNVANAFHADSSFAKNHTILLVDDVATTGATLSACAQALLDAGANQVYGMTLARAMIHQDGK